MQILRRIAEAGRELIEGNQRGVDFFKRQIPLLHRAHLAQTDLAQLSRKRFVLGRNAPDDVDVFEPGLPIKPKVRQVLPEESKTFAKEKNRDQGEDDDGDERVAAEERLDALFDGSLDAAGFRSGRDENAGIGDAFHAAAHSRNRPPSGNLFSVTFV